MLGETNQRQTGVDHTLSTISYVNSLSELQGQVLFISLILQKSELLNKLLFCKEPLTSI